MPVTLPTGYPGWASGPSGWIAEPTAIVKALGHQPNVAPLSSYENWFKNLVYNWILYNHQSIANTLLGDGSDGDLTIVGMSGAAGTTSIYSMSRHLLLNNLTVTGISAILDTNGYIPFVRGRFAGVSGTLRLVGANGSTAGASGVGLGATAHPGPLSGGAGGGGSGAGGSGGVFGYAGEVLVNALGGTGGFGGGSFSQPAQIVGPTGMWRRAPPAVDGILTWLAANRGVTSSSLRGGGGGGAGGAGLGVAPFGGGGGEGGGVIIVPCQEVDFIGVIDVRGGAGGADGSTGKYNGGGGGGGAGILTYGKKTNLSAFVNSTPGSGASLGLNAFPGITGIVEIKLTY